MADIRNTFNDELDDREKVEMWMGKNEKEKSHWKSNLIWNENVIIIIVFVYFLSFHPFGMYSSHHLYARYQPRKKRQKKEIKNLLT